MSEYYGGPGGGPGIREPEFDPDDADDLRRIRLFIGDVRRFMEDVYENPPVGLEGEYFDDEREGWRNLPDIHEILVGRITEDLRIPLRSAGLTGAAGTAKYRRWKEAAKAFVKLRNARRTSRALNVAASIMASIADIANLGEAWKEAMEGLKYITDLALEEGGS